MSIKIALAGNPNCGKTTLFNNLTGSNQYVGNWPGVTVEKKEGKLKGEKDVIIQDLPGIYPIDTHKLTTGVGEMVLAACKMRDEGMDAASIAKAMEEMIPRVNVSFVIDTLEYMWKGGRCTGVAAFGANLLNLKPCIEMRDGKLEVCKKYRGNIEKVYHKYITERLSAQPVDPNYIFITTSNQPSPELAQQLENTVRAAVPDVKEVLFTRTGCTVTSHCGPGTLGVLFLEK